MLSRLSIYQIIIKFNLYNSYTFCIINNPVSIAIGSQWNLNVPLWLKVNYLLILWNMLNLIYEKT